MPDNTTPGGVSLSTLAAVMGACCNHFIRSTLTANFTVSDGALVGAGTYLRPGQYYRIRGSVFNDGVHRYGDAADTLTDETFSGRVDGLAPPRDFLDLAAEIDGWKTKYGEAAASPYSAESFVGYYSYTKASGVTQDGVSGGWEAVYRAKLARYRKVKED